MPFNPRFAAEEQTPTGPRKDDMPTHAPDDYRRRPPMPQDAPEPPGRDDERRR